VTTSWSVEFLPISSLVGGCRAITPIFVCFLSVSIQMWLHPWDCLVSRLIYDNFSTPKSQTDAAWLAWTLKSETTLVIMFWQHGHMVMASTSFVSAFEVQEGRAVMSLTWAMAAVLYKLSAFICAVSGHHDSQTVFQLALDFQAMSSFRTFQIKTKVQYISPMTTLVQWKCHLHKQIQCKPNNKNEKYH
jgi:hypothetical protein